MTHVISSLCLRDNGCSNVCPVERINPGQPAQGWPNYYIDPATCIDRGACVPECPYNAIFPEDEVPSDYRAKGGEYLNRAGLKGSYTGSSHKGEPVRLETVQALAPGELVDLTESIHPNRAFYRQ